MRASGETIFNTEKEWRPGQMARDTTANMLSVASTESVPTSGMMGPNIQENGKKTRYQALVSTPG